MTFLKIHSRMLDLIGIFWKRPVVRYSGTLQASWQHIGRLKVSLDERIYTTEIGESRSAAPQSQFLNIYWHITAFKFLTLRSTKIEKIHLAHKVHWIIIQFKINAC